MRFPAFEGPTMEFLVLKHDSIVGKEYLVQWPDSAPKREDETWLHRRLLSYPQAVMMEANDLDANDPLLLEYSCYETSGGRARTAAKDAVKAIKINVDKLEQASDTEEDEQDDAPPTQRARHARTATISIGITVHTGGVGADLQPFLQCPITQEIMNDPVIAADGQTYERRALARWLRRNNSSPLTGLEMDAWMVPNHAVKSMIAKLNSTPA